MRNKAMLLVGFSIITGLWRTAQAEPPIYAPYGAWRGRIRYVEGPRHVRTHIRWGGGITPVGGQVLTHLATVAGNVVTNENFLNAATGRVTRDAELNPEIANLNGDIERRNSELLAELNTVRVLLDMNTVTESTSVTQPNENENFGHIVPPGTETDLTSKLKAHKELWGKTNELRSGIKATIKATIAAVEMLPPQNPLRSRLEALNKLQGFFSDAKDSAASGSVDPTDEAIKKEFDDIASQLKTLRKDASELISTGKTIRDEDQQQEKRIKPQTEDAHKWLNDIQDIEDARILAVLST